MDEVRTRVQATRSKVLLVSSARGEVQARADVKLMDLLLLVAIRAHRGEAAEASALREKIKDHFTTSDDEDRLTDDVIDETAAELWQEELE